jgi:SNF family Na+-dependent transporter
MFVWLFRPEHAWEEIHRGANVWIPRFFLWVLTYVTPPYLLVLFVVWAMQYSPAVFATEDRPPGDAPWR